MRSSIPPALPMSVGHPPQSKPTPVMRPSTCAKIVEPESPGALEFTKVGNRRNKEIRIDIRRLRI